MSSSKLATRLREIMRGPAAAAPPPASTALPEAQPSDAGSPERRDTPVTAGMRLAESAAATLGGRILDGAVGPCVVVDRTYHADHVHGLLRVGDWARHLHHQSPALAVLAGPRAEGTDDDAHRSPLGLVDAGPGDCADARDILFVDLETTGLAGGAGTYAFLVGCAWFEAEALRVRQFFMLGHALERALLSAVRQRLDACATLVTYNGKTFDVPLLETRYLYNRQPVPFTGRSHVDMLHAARRLWRGARPVVAVPGGQTDSCALSALEQVLCGVQRHGDVPGFEIPGRYFAFLRSGDARPLEPVLEHNRLDLVSLAALTARALQLLEAEGQRGDQPRECLGLGRIFEGAARWRAAEHAYSRAVALAAQSWHAEDEVVHAEALRSLALRCRRTQRYLEAASYWEAITCLRRCPPELLREALEALAIHHEHRSRDLERARRFAEQSQRVGTPARTGIEQRLARIDRKLAHHATRVAHATSAPLLK